MVFIMILALLMPYGANPVQAAGNNSSSEDQGWETDSGQDAGGRIDQEQPLPDGELPGGGKVQQQSMKLSNLTDSSGSLLVHYKLDETAGSKAANSAVTGAVYDADLQGGTSWTTGVDGGALDFNGTDGHIKLPSGILNDVNDVTLSSWVKLDAQKTWQTVYTFASSQQKYMILSPQGNPGGKPVGVTLVINNGNGEQRISTGAGTELPSGVWSHVVFTLSGHVGTLYVDGKVAAVKEDFTITPADLGVTTSNYIGKPIFSDPYLDGKLDDFRIYKRAISEQEVKEMVSAGNLAMVDADAAALSLGDLSAVTTDLKLPAVGESGASLSWISSKPSVIDSHGKVYPPARGQANEMVTLTATLKKGNTETTKTFEVTVLALSDSLAVKKAVDRLVLPLTINQGHVLPVSGENGTAIQWTAADHRVSISKEGMVSADLSGAGNQRISTTLTAVASLGHEHASRTLDVTVIEPYAGYILSYFRDGQEGQALHFGYSYDGLHWVELNNNAAVLQATIGSKAVRDPFLMRKKDGSFIVIATQGWDNPSLYLWDSPDLTSFTGERLVKLSDFGPRAWAPEAYYDRETDKFVFYWSDPGIGPIFSNTTSDFMNFSPSETYFSTGYPIIDATITAWNNEYYLFFKDERGDNTPSTTGKAIKLAKSSSLAPGSFELVNPGYITDKLVEGPFVLKSFTEDKWYLYYDYFVEGGRFGVSVTDDLAAGIWTPLSADQYNMPAGVRHGGSIPVTQDELNAIIKKWGAPTLDILKVKAAADVAAGIGTSFSELNLPATVDVQLKDGSIRPVNVAWDQAGYNGNVPGEYKLAGSMKLPAGVANPGSKQAEIKVIVSVSNKVRLQAAIVQAKSLDVTKYKPATWEVLAQELAAAEKVNTDVGATQSLVDQVTKKLTAAIQGLELVDPPAPVADKTLLQAVMDQAKALQAAAYTPATWEVLKQALAEGEQVYASLTTTQAEVDQVCAELLQAIAGLKPNLETEGPGNPGTPTPTPTPKPTSTPTVKPSAAPTPKPTSSVTPTPLQTVSPKPAATKSPVTTVLNGIAVAKLTSNERTVTVPASELNGLPLQVQALGAKITVDAQLIAGLLDWESDAVKKNASIIVKLDAVSSVGQIQPAPATGNLQLKASGESFDISVLLRTPDGKEVRLQSVQGGVTIELPYKAESASNKDLLAIYYYNETTSRWEYLGGEVNPDTKTVKVKLQHLSRYAVLSYSHSFRDVPSSHWADTALSVLSAKQIVTGSAEGFFHPTTKTTRAEFTAMLARALQLNAEQPNGQFADVSPEAWYAKEVTAAYQAGLIQGKSDKKFSPDGELTREEMALILVRAMKYKNQILNENSTALSGYADSGQVAPWASQAVNQIIESGLMTGPSSTSFAPKGDVRRAEVAQAIYRFVQTIQQP